MHNVFTEMQSKLRTVTSFCQIIKQMRPTYAGSGKTEKSHYSVSATLVHEILGNSFVHNVKHAFCRVNANGAEEC